MTRNDTIDKASESGKLHSHSLIWTRRKLGRNEERILKSVESYVVLFFLYRTVIAVLKYLIYDLKPVEYKEQAETF